MLLRWNAGEREFEDITHPDVEVFSAVTNAEYHGIEGARRWINEIDEQFSAWRLDFEEIDEVGEDTLLIRGSIFLRGRQSGAEFEQPSSWVVVLRDGLLRTMRTFPTREGAGEYLASR